MIKKRFYMKKYKEATIYQCSMVIHKNKLFTTNYKETRVFQACQINERLTAAVNWNIS